MVSARPRGDLNLKNNQNYSSWVPPLEPAVSVTYLLPGGSCQVALTHAVDRPAQHTHSLTKLVLCIVSLLTHTLAEYLALFLWCAVLLAQVQEDTPERALAAPIFEQHAALVLS